MRKGEKRSGRFCRRRNRAAASAASAAAAAARTTSPRMSQLQLVPAAALRGTAMEADSAQLGEEEEEEEEEEESEEVVPYAQLHMFSQGGSCCMCVLG